MYILEHLFYNGYILATFFLMFLLGPVEMYLSE